MATSNVRISLLGRSIHKSEDRDGVTYSKVPHFVKLTLDIVPSALVWKFIPVPACGCEFVAGCESGDPYLLLVRVSHIP